MKISKCKILTWILTLVVVLQIMVIFGINLTQGIYHMGTDSSSNYLKAYEFWKQKTLLCDNWINTTTLFWDLPAPLAGLLMNLFNNIFVSYGVANILIGIGIIFLLIRIGKKMELTTNALLLVMLILLCPYIGTNYSNVNDLGYFSCVWVSAAFYSVKVMHTLLAIDCYMELKDGKGKLSKIGIMELIASCVLCFVTGASSGIHLIVTVLLPIFLYCLGDAIINGKYRLLVTRSSIYIYTCAIIIYLGKVFSKTVLEFQVRDADITLVSINGFWKNLGSIIMGYVSLLKGLPYDGDVAVLSLEGISYLCSLFIVLLTIVGFVFSIIKVIKEKKWNDKIVILISIIIINLCMFMIANMTYGAAVYEERYLINIFIMMAFAVGNWIDSVKFESNVKCLIQIVILIALSINILISDREYIREKNDMDVYKVYSDIAANENVSVVYFFGNPNLDLEIIERNLRIYDTGVIYKWLKNDDNQNRVMISHWGDYTDYDNRIDYDGKILLFVSKEDYKDMLFGEKNELELLTNIGNTQVYTCPYNIFGNPK